VPQNDHNLAEEQQGGNAGPEDSLSRNLLSGEPIKVNTDAEQTAQIKNLNRKVVWTWIVAAFGPLLALAGLVFAALQWKAADGQLAVAKAQLKDARDGAAQARKDTEAVIAAAKSQAESMKTVADANKAMADAAKLNAATAQRMANLSASQLERTDRPAVNVDLAAADSVEATERGMQFSLRVLLSNQGRSEATNVHTHIGITYGDRVLISKELTSDCIVADTLSKSDLGGMSIRPMDRQVFDFVELLNAETIHAHEFSINGAGGKFFTPVVAGCVSYLIPYSSSRHHTPFVFNVYRKPRTVNEVWSAYQLGVSVPVENVILTPDALIKRKPD